VVQVALFLQVQDHKLNVRFQELLQMMTKRKDQ